MRTIARLRWLLLVLAALPAVGGCYSGDLTVDIQVVREMNSLAYTIEPRGHLKLMEGGGLVEGETGRTLYETDLDDADMRKLRKVIQKSGFLVEPEPIRGSLEGVFLVVDIKMGLWANRMRIRGVPVKSVGKITDEIDKYLPEKHRIRYHAAAATKEDEDYQKYMR